MTSTESCRKQTRSKNSNISAEWQNILKNKRIVSNNCAESHPKNFIDVSTLFLGNDKDLHKFLQHTYAVSLNDIVYPTWSNG